MEIFDLKMVELSKFVASNSFVVISVFTMQYKWVKTP